VFCLFITSEFRLQIGYALHCSIKHFYFSVQTKSNHRLCNESDDGSLCLILNLQYESY